ncbi:MAG: PLP-dependent aminotransferase family protein, partial [Terriglobales bacterium]
MPRHAGTLPLPISLQTGGPSVHRQIYAWFRGSILRGQVLPGQAVPSSRALARELGLSRGSVVLAYEQLIAEGYLEAIVGSATRVVRSLAPAADASHRSVLAPSRLTPSALRLAAAPPQPWLELRGPFRMHTPALTEFPVAAWARLVSRHARGLRKSDMGYGEAMGLPRLRVALAGYLGAARGVRCDADRIMVVAGSQQGLDLAARTLLNPGDRVAVEEPGYSGARQAFRAAGLRLVPVSVDAEGLDVDALARLRPPPRAVYVTPSHKYPMGVTMSATRRLQLLQWAARAGAWIFEDDY